MVNLSEKIIILDTTLREGELRSGIQINRQDKINLAQLLEQIEIDVIEVSYPAQSRKDFEDLVSVSEVIHSSFVCGLSGIQAREIEQVVQALKSANRPRIHLYSNTNLRGKNIHAQELALQEIAAGIKLARNSCDNVQWSAFDATRSKPSFLCQAIETAIRNGVTTVSIADSLGVCSSEEFSQLLEQIFNQVFNIEKAIISVHCHDDLGQSIKNSLIALNYGVRQIEVSINGIGARKGNANLEIIATELARQKNYSIGLNLDLLPQASALLRQVLE